MSLESTELKIGDTSFKGVWIAIVLGIGSTIGGGVWTASSLYSRLEAVEAQQIPDISPIRENLATLGTRLETLLSQQEKLLELKSELSTLSKEIEAMKGTVAAAEIITKDNEDIVPFYNKILSSTGFDVTDILTNADITEKLLNKNDKNLLPIKASEIKSVAVIGANATKKNALGGFGAGVKTKREVTPLEGLQNRLPASVKINYAEGYQERYAPKKEAKFGDVTQERAETIDELDSKLVEEALNAAKNAVLLAAQILATADTALSTKLIAYKEELKKKIEESAKDLGQ